MSEADKTVARALRSSAKLVVVEAPAGCGKTFQGSRYAVETGLMERSRVLVLTHTHAAVDEFASRASQSGAHMDVRTIDGLITEIASAYHRPLGLPEDVGRWAAQESDGFKRVAELVARLMGVTDGPGRALVRRYPVAVFDEHQDASEAQSAVLHAILRAGGRVRVFGDPMQIIYPDEDAETDRRRWLALWETADHKLRLDSPHRWLAGNPELGEWILQSREALASGGQIDLRGRLPIGLTIHRADDNSSGWRQYGTTQEDGEAIRRMVRSRDVLVLTSLNKTVRALRPYFGRRIRLWEGHTRPALTALAKELTSAAGNPEATARALVTFVQEVGKGFSDSSFGTRLLTEVREGCARTTSGKPALLQELGRCVLKSPDHRGVARALRMLWELQRSEKAFSAVEIDHRTEFWDAVRLGDFDDLEQGLGGLAQRRTWVRAKMPARALSTVHKAKGIERDSVLIMPCDREHFGNRLKDRCAMYVAMSRATRELTLVVPRTGWTPLFKIDPA